MTLHIVPISLSAANTYVASFHRHHSNARGCKFCIGVKDSASELRGVAIAGRPVSRHLDNGLTLEITRCCTDGVKNGCSKLYSAIARIARQMGYRRIITYTLAHESGASLKATGWSCQGFRGGGSWSRISRPRQDRHPTEQKLLWEAP